MRATALCLLLPALVAAQDRKPKVEYKSAEDGYTVLFPGNPKVQSFKLSTVAGPLPVRIVRYEPSAELVLSVTTTSYPKEFSAVAPEKLFDGMLKEMEAADGKAKDETPDGGLTLGSEKVPGRQWRIESRKTVVRVRVYLVGSRLYQVMANGSKAGADSPLADEFFASFRLDP